ncbi:MAG: hypothetical protein NC489_07975 [Ruminococcus flavefaciens]|nr:hypothetical protein [Ruminococcus flavefaciens]
MAISCLNILTETVVAVDRPAFVCLSEEAQLQVTDDVLSGMMKFITDKYNSLDFREIEKSAGDIAKFRYRSMLMENTEMLYNVYSSSPDPGAKKYLEVAEAIQNVMAHLDEYRMDYMTQYQAGNGLVQLLYVSLVSGCLYCVGTLVSNTIRFVTTDKDADCQVMFDEIPGTIKHVHIANILSANRSIAEFQNLLRSYRKQPKPVHEAVDTFIVGAAIAAGVIMLIPKIIVLIREIIYSIYFYRVRISEMLALQADLVNTNIESLEAGRGNKKVIARQKKIVDKLEKWKNRIAIKTDTVNSMVLAQKKKENDALRIDRNSPIVRDPGSFSPGDLMI